MSGRKLTSSDQKSHLNRSENLSARKITMKKLTDNNKSKPEASIIKASDKSTDSAQQQLKPQDSEANKSSSSSRSLSGLSNICSEFGTQIKTTRNALQKSNLSKEQLIQLLNESDEMILKLIEDNDNLNVLLGDHIKVSQELSTKAAALEKEVEITKKQLTVKNQIVKEVKETSAKLEERLNNVEKENSLLHAEISRLREQARSNPTMYHSLEATMATGNNSEIKLNETSSELKSYVKQPEKSHLLQYLKAKYRDNRHSSEKKTDTSVENRLRARNVNKENTPFSQSVDFNYYSCDKNTSRMVRENNRFILEEEEDSLDESDFMDKSQNSVSTARDLAAYQSKVSSNPFDKSKRTRCSDDVPPLKNLPVKNRPNPPQEYFPNKSLVLRPLGVNETMNSDESFRMKNELSPTNFMQKIGLFSNH